MLRSLNISHVITIINAGKNSTIYVYIMKHSKLDTVYVYWRAQWIPKRSFWAYIFVWLILFFHSLLLSLLQCYIMSKKSYVFVARLFFSLLSHFFQFRVSRKKKFNYRGSFFSYIFTIIERERRWGWDKKFRYIIMHIQLDQ